MRISVPLGLLLISAAAPTAALAQRSPAAPPPAPPALAPISDAMDDIVHALRLDGAALAVVRTDGTIHQSEHGRLAGAQVLPIASASKWLAVATILTLVDDGVLDLDVPVARYLQEFDRDDKDDLTLRQCLSCTAGFQARIGGRMRGWGSGEFAAAAADTALRLQPGEGFHYGGMTFQVAAVAAERVTGKSWHELFAARIAEPLGLEQTRFGGLYPIAGEPGTHPLPWVAGGAVSSLNDYTKFVRCLVDRGRCGDRQVLSEASVAAMFRDSVPRNVAVQAPGIDVDDVRYGLGTWIFPIAGESGAVRVADPGAFGFTPWIDLDLGIGGVFAVKDRVRRVFDRLTGIMDRVRDVARSPLVAGTDESFTLHHDGRTRRYLLHVPAHDANSAGLPLVLVLHGGGGNGEIAAQSTGFAAVADREGFAVAFPDGTGKLPRRLLTWNDGVLPVYAVDREVDDVGFLREVVTDVARRVPIDAGRVFAVGHSNGGMMCHRLARDAADLFAGIAVVSGAMNYTAKDSAAAIGVVLVHGTADEHVPYLGGKPTQATGRAGEREDTSVQAAVDYYLARNGLLGYPDSSTDPQRPGVRVDTYGKDKLGEASWTPVRVITLEGGGHAWPSTDGKAPRRLLADRPFPFDASQAIWDFFTLVRRDGGVTARPGKTKGSPPAVPR